MLDRKGGQMSIRHEISVHAWQRHQRTQHFAMFLGWLRYPRGFTSEPIENLAPGICGGCGRPEYSRVSHNSHEGKQARPWQPNSRKTAQLSIEPFTRLLMLGRFLEKGINEKIGIDQNHLNVSPSAIASTSAILSRLGT